MNMLERVARGMAQRDYPDQPKSWHEIVWPEYSDAARAVFVDMRGPTREMLEAVDDEDSDKYVARGRAISAWTAMLDAASKGEK